MILSILGWISEPTGSLQAVSRYFKGINAEGGLQKLESSQDLHLNSVFGSWYIGGLYISFIDIFKTVRRDFFLKMKPNTNNFLD